MAPGLLGGSLHPAQDQRRVGAPETEGIGQHHVDLPAAGLDFNDVVTRFENDLIAQALEQTRWNKNRAAQLLGLNRTTLIEKIKKRGLQRPAPPP